MKNYETYLLKHQYSHSTIEVHCLRIRRFMLWLKHYGITVQELNYNSLLHYAKYLQEEKKYQRTSTNNELRAIKLYYDYLIEEADRIDNPAEGMAIRGKRIKVLNNLLSEEELEDLYYSYQTEHKDTFFKATKQRDKVVAGMLVFQGITAIEIYHLQDDYLDLRKGKIEIPSTRRSNRRTLPLQPLQIIDLLNYTQTTKQYLLKKIKTHNDEQLIFGSIHQIRSITNRIIKNLKKYNHKVTSHSQIRSSIIVNWLEKKNLRQVQYLAGHRYISSTEKYVQDDLENLHEIVNNYHPIS